jgi:hypothetical protein
MDGYELLRIPLIRGIIQAAVACHNGPYRGYMGSKEGYIGGIGVPIGVY